MKALHERDSVRKIIAWCFLLSILVVVQVVIFQVSFSGYANYAKPDTEASDMKYQKYYSEYGRKEETVGVESKSGSENDVGKALYRVLQFTKYRVNITSHTTNIEAALTELWVNMQYQNQNTQVASCTLHRTSTVKQEDIVLVTQCGLSKFNNFLTQVQWWKGPVAAAVFLQSQNEIGNFIDFIRANLALLRKTSIAVVFERHRQKYFPVNTLRNFAMQLVDTDYFLALDVDFIPSRNSYDGLRNLLRTDAHFRDQLRHNKTMFVLPAFELLPPPNHTEASEVMLPHSNQQLVEMLEQDQVELFHVRTFPEGHAPTDYTKWISLQQTTTGLAVAAEGAKAVEGHEHTQNHRNQYTKPAIKSGLRHYMVPVQVTKYYPIRYQVGFEPYVLGYRPGIPPYWPTLRGYAYNKYVWFLELDAAGYHFETLVDFYVIHLYHSLLTTYEKFIDMRFNYPQVASFIDYMKEKYNRTNSLWVPSEENMKNLANGMGRQKMSLRSQGLGRNVFTNRQGELISSMANVQKCPNVRKDILSLKSVLMDAWLKIGVNFEDSEEQGCYLPKAVKRRKFVNQDDDIMLLTHLDSSKLLILLEQLKWWNGPASVAVYLRSYLDIDAFSTFVNENRQALSSAALHVVLEKGKKSYPYNILRNLALENCNTNYFVALDVDLIPSWKAHAELSRLIKTNNNVRNMLRTQKTLFVLPAFDLWSYNSQDIASPDMLPRSIEQVLDMTENKQISGSTMDYHPVSQAPTNFSKWYDIQRENQKSNLNNKTESDAYYTIEYADRFEPYILGYRPQIPLYWPWFRGYGYNKYSWFMELNAAGYRFAVLTDFFVVHREHPEKENLAKFQEMQENYKMALAFNRYLKNKYNRQYIFLRPSQKAIEAEKIKKEQVESKYKRLQEAQNMKAKVEERYTLNHKTSRTRKQIRLQGPTKL